MKRVLIKDAMGKLRFLMRIAFLLSIVLSFTGCQTQRANTGDFSIFLLSDGLPAAKARDLPLSELYLDENPLISIDEILSYTSSTHEIQLTEAGYEKINQMSFPTDGIPFVISIGDEVVYMGAFWPLYSSSPFDGVVIRVPIMENRSIQISLGYPGEILYTGDDPRSDPRIMDALETAGKLK